MSATTVMSALSSILPASTAIASTYVEAGVEVENGSWPVIVLSCPATKEVRAGTGRKKEHHQIVVQYLDRWETSTRTLAQLTTDARTALEQMKANVRANHTLTVNGSPNALLAGDTMDTQINGPIEAKTYPFPLFSAALHIDVDDLWMNA